MHNRIQKLSIAVVSALASVILITQFTGKSSANRVVQTVADYALEFPDGLDVDLGRIPAPSTQEFRLRLINRSSRVLPADGFEVVTGCCAKGKIVTSKIDERNVAPNLETTLRFEVQIGAPGGAQLLQLPVSIRRDGVLPSDDTERFFVRVAYQADQPRQAMWSVPSLNFGILKPGEVLATRQLHLRIHDGSQGASGPPSLSLDDPEDVFQVELGDSSETPGQFGKKATAWAVRVTLRPVGCSVGVHTAFLCATLAPDDVVRVPIQWTVSDSYDRAPAGTVTLLTDNRQETKQRIVFRCVNGDTIRIASAECSLTELTAFPSEDQNSAVLIIQIPPNLRPQTARIRVRFTISSAPDDIREESIPCNVTEIVASQNREAG